MHSVASRVWVNGEATTWDTNPDAGTFGGWMSEYVRNGAGYLYGRAFDGTQGSAWSSLLTWFGSDPDRPWQSDMIGRGTTYFVLTALFNREVFTNVPSVRLEVQGLRLYDPRLDTTVGGSGAHRWGQPGTYAWTDNPAVIIYNILRGIYYDGELIYGPAVPGTSLPLANWFAAMNECDVVIGGERQFRCGYEIRVADEQPVEVIEELLKACNGRMAEIGGVYKIHVGPPALPVFFCTDDDFVVTEEQEYDPFRGLEQTYNGVTATYPEPLSGWEMKDAPQRRYPAFEAEDDGRILLADVQFSAVPFPVQVQRLMKALAEDNRRFRTNQGTLPPVAMILEPLDTISWTSARNGYSSKRMQLDAIQDRADAFQAVSLIEVDPSDYDWEPSDELPWSVGPLVPTWPVAQVLSGWQVQPAELRDTNDAGRRPSIEVFFDGQLTDIRAVRILVRLAATQQIQFDAELPYGDPATNPSLRSVILNGVFLPNEEYEVSGKFLPFSGRETTWSAWLPVTTPNILFGAEDIYLPGLVEEVNEFVREFTEWQTYNTREVIEETRRNVNLDIEADAGAYEDIQKTRRQLVSVTSGYRAEWREDILVATGPSSALSQRLEELEVAVDDPVSGLEATSTIVNLLSAQINDPGTGLVAQNNAILALDSTVGNFSASGLFRVYTQATPSGANARIALSVSATGGGSPTTAALFLDAMTGGASRVAITANQFAVLTSPTGSAFAPFIIDGGVVYIDNGRIRDLTSANINVQQLLASSVFADNLVVRNAQIDNLTIGPEKLQPNSIQRSASAGGSLPTVGATMTDLVALTISNPTGRAVHIFTTVTAVTGSFQWFVDRGSTQIGSNGATGASNLRANEGFCDESPPSGNSTYYIRVVASGTTNSVTGTIKAVWSTR